MYLATLRYELLRLARACGVDHPALVGSEHLELLEEDFQGVAVRDLFGYEPGWGLPSPTDREELRRLMQGV